MTATTDTSLLRGHDDTLNGLRIIDCDSHFTEPTDLWRSRAPIGLRDRMPVQKTVDGVTSWYLDGELWAGGGGNTIATGREKVRGVLEVAPFDVVDVCAWSVKERLELLDEMGVFAQIIYPNGVGFSSNHMFAIDDEVVRRAVLEIYNDFLVEVQHASGGRLFPQAVLPVWDMDQTIAEMIRLIDQDIRGFTLTDKPELIGLPELHDPYFAPMWSLFNESGTVPNFHIGAGGTRAEVQSYRRVLNRQADAKRDTNPSTTWRLFGPQRTLAINGTQQYMSNVRIISNLCMSDMFDRYPNLKIVSAESGIGWVPFLLESLEYQYDEMITDPHEYAMAKRRPSEYFHDHLYVMFWFEKLALEQRTVDMIGRGNILIETDVPHPTCLYPGAREHFSEVLSGLDDGSRRRIVQDNAAELYRIRLPA